MTPQYCIVKVFNLWCWSIAGFMSENAVFRLKKIQILH